MPFNPLFDDSKGDLVLRSADGLDSRVRSVKLRGVSDVFNSMLEAGAEAEQDKTDEGLPVVKLDDDGTVLGHFLQYAIDPRLISTGITFEQTTQCVSIAPIEPRHRPDLDVPRVLSLTDKYEAVAATSLVLARLVAQHLEMHPSTVFALAAIHGDLTVARLALAESGRNISCNSSNVFGLTGLLMSVDQAIFVRIPPAALYTYFCHVSNILGLSGGDGSRYYRWKAAAMTYSVRAPGFYTIVLVD